MARYLADSASRLQCLKGAKCNNNVGDAGWHKVARVEGAVLSANSALHGVVVVVYYI